jgi:hypothetical protein
MLESGKETFNQLLIISGNTCPVAVQHGLDEQSIVLGCHARRALALGSNSRCVAIARLSVHMF